MARAALNWTVRDLAKASGLHRNTVSNLEIGRYAGDPQTIAIIEQVLSKAGIEFIDENGGGPGVRLRKRSRQMRQNRPPRLHDKKEGES
jgi:transcriptional regulator with XRE-family HTH domain